MANAMIKDRQCNGQMIKWPQTMQWRNDKGQTMQWRNDKGQTIQ